jgi:hypothetical protein
MNTVLTEPGHTVYTEGPKKMCTNINRGYLRTQSEGSVAGIATGYGLDNRGVGVRVLVGSRILSSTNCPDHYGVHPTSFPMGTRGSFPGGKVTGA